MTRLSVVRRSCDLLAIALVAVACTAGAISTTAPPPTAAPMATTAAASTPSPERAAAPVTRTAPAAQPASASSLITPSPAATAAEDATEVAGTEEFVALKSPGTTTMVDGVAQIRGNEVALKDTMNDTRVTGNGTSHGNYDKYVDVAVQWGTYQLANTGGSWEGPWAGVVSSGMIEDATAWLTGQGGYAGLTYYLHFRGLVGGPYEITGLIYPGEPPAR
jgi:hypothetical protein